ncbi:hypothetical protein [Corynebacterium hindlerae]|uniref:hypothetical protein n=1 Tax=Corynebacterium hindlerae TaxID=699041 RepID=UPI003AAEA12D
MHLTVVAVPVIALLAILAAVRPTWYLKNKWLTTGLAALAVVSTAVTNSTGEALMVLKGGKRRKPWHLRRPCPLRQGRHHFGWRVSGPIPATALSSH